MNGRELDTVDRRILVAREAAIVIERHDDRLALGEGLVEIQTHAEILLRARRRHLPPAIVCHTCHVQRVVQLECRRGDVVLQRHKADRRLGRQSLRVFVDLGVDDVVLDINAGAALLSRRGRGRSERYHDPRHEDPDVTKHVLHVLPLILPPPPRLFP